MRKVIAGNGSDSTAATQAWLMATSDPIIRDLYIIGPPNSPYALYLTNHEAPVLYAPYGKFQPATIKRGGVIAKVGLDAQALAITWSPGLSAQLSATVNTGTASPYQLAAQHFYDNWPVLILRCFMPTPGDANTLGCAVWFGGRVQNCKIARGELIFNTKSYLDVVSQKVPSTVIEVTNTLAATAAVTIPAGDASIPIFKCAVGSSENYILADCLSPAAGHIYDNNKFAGGYLVFLSGAGATLAGAWSGISQNGQNTDIHSAHHSYFEIYLPLPWPPTPTVDTFYVSMAAPADASSGAQSGFPYVPSPQAAA